MTRATMRAHDGLKRTQKRMVASAALIGIPEHRSRPPQSTKGLGTRKTPIICVSLVQLNFGDKNNGRRETPSLKVSQLLRETHSKLPPQTPQSHTMLTRLMYLSCTYDTRQHTVQSVNTPLTSRLDHTPLTPEGD